MNALINVAYFLVDTLFSLYLILLVVRLLLGLTRADFHNPISQFVVTATNPVIVPLRRILPPIGKIDTANVTLLVIFKLIQSSLLSLIRGENVSIAAIFTTSIIELLLLVIYVFIFSIIIQAVMSWVNPGASSSHNPLIGVVNSITRPIIEPFSRIIPKMGMFDLSPLAALLFLNILLIIVKSI